MDEHKHSSAAGVAATTAQVDKTDAQARLEGSPAVQTDYPPSEEYADSTEDPRPLADELNQELGDMLDRPACLLGARKGKSLRKKGRKPRSLSGAQRLMILDAWRRSDLSAPDFAPLVGMTVHTLYSWRQRFAKQGPEGLLGAPRGARPGSRLAEVTQRTILMLKEAHPEYGCQRISDLLARGPGLGASPGAVSNVLKEAGYELVEEPTKVHEPVVRRFERARPNQLWQTDLFTFILKRQNRRVYLIGFMDDHSRFMVGFGLHASSSAAVTIEVLRKAIADYGVPQEVLTDNGPQYHAWRGTSAFRRECDKLGIKQIVARPKHPQTLGKIERFWGTLYNELVETTVFLDLEDARERIAQYIGWYNFQRPHQGLDGLVPADRFFAAAPEVRATMAVRVAQNAKELAVHGQPREPFYLTGQVGGQAFSVHAQGERVILTKEGSQQQVALVAPLVQTAPVMPSAPAAPVVSHAPAVPSVSAPAAASSVAPSLSALAAAAIAATPPTAEPTPGTSPLDTELRRLVEGLRPGALKTGQGGGGQP